MDGQINAKESRYSLLLSNSSFAIQAIARGRMLTSVAAKGCSFMSLPLKWRMMILSRATWLMTLFVISVDSQEWGWVSSNERHLLFFRANWVLKIKMKKWAFSLHYNQLKARKEQGWHNRPNSMAPVGRRATGGIPSYGEAPLGCFIKISYQVALAEFN